MPYTLLLADDSVTIQRVIELTFADEDVTVVAVSDGDQAIARLEASPPDIVLADIGMPGKNGYEVAHYIRQSPKLSHIPVVLLTGAFEPVDQARANAAGCDGVLAKPFEPQLVISRVKELLARSRRGPEAPPPDVHPGGAAEGDFSLPPLAEPRAVTPFAEPRLADAPIAAEPTGPVPRTELNDYFDRLDAAFSTLSSNTPAPVPGPAPAGPIADPPPAAIETDIDWFGNETGGGNAEPWDLPAPPSDTGPAADLPLSHGSPQPEASLSPLAEPEPVAEIAPFEAPDERFAPIEESAPIEPDAWAAAPPAPPASLAPPAPAAAARPAAPALELPLPNPPPLPALADAFAALLAAEQGEPLSPSAGTWPASLLPAPVVSDALIEDVVGRVLDRLSHTVVREAVADIASKIAERVIREEIERIKSSIK